MVFNEDLIILAVYILISGDMIKKNQMAKIFIQKGVLYEKDMDILKFGILLEFFPSYEFSYIFPFFLNFSKIAEFL